MLVNGVSHIVAFLPASSAPGSSTLTVPLNSGAANVIEFEAYDSLWGELSFLLAREELKGLLLMRI